MLVKKIADGMNGEVTFVSHEGEGSEFKVKVEVERVDIVEEESQL